MAKCSQCSIPIEEEGIKAQWNTYSYKRDVRPFVSGKPIKVSYVPVPVSHQGILCQKCFVQLSAYKVERFSDLQPSPKKKEKRENLSFDW